MTEPLSPKQLQSYQEATGRINLWEGSVRSGKTFASILKFIKMLKDGPPGHAMIVGVSRDAIQRNIVLELCGLLGLSPPTPKSTQLNVFGRNVFLVGANDERAQRRIQGSTIALAYVDELTLIPHGFFNMLLSRLSVPGAKLFCTTNPDSPFHWVKTELLSNKMLDLKHWKFNLYDNPSLTDEYIFNLKQEYSGLWYKRYIDGDWVLAEGTVYDFFNEDDHVINTPPGPADYYVVGLDYGTANPTAFTLIGYSKRYFPNIWVEKEYYYDSKKYNRQKTDSDYVEDLKDFILGKTVRAIYVDPSAASLKNEMQKQGVSNIYDADHDVLNGIRFTAKMIANGTLKICSNCSNLIREFQTYRWDEKVGLRGEDKPIKEFDHCFVAGTKVLTKTGYKNIEEIQKGEEVLTRAGWNEVIYNFENMSEVYKFKILGKEVVATKNHKVLTVNGWKNIQDLIPSDIYYIEAEELPWQSSLYFRESNTDVTQTLKTLLTEDISRCIKPIASKDIHISIGMFGNTIMETFPKDTIFITKTEIPSTMTLAISNVYQLLCICPSMEKICQSLVDLNLEDELKEYVLSQKNGTEVKKEENGIESMQKEHGNLSKENLNVNNAERNISQQKKPMQNFVQISVNHHLEEVLVLIMNIENALTVLNHLKSTNIQNQSVVQNPVEENYIGEKKVYNLHIEENHEYFVENILVHNCLDSLRYVTFTHFSKDYDSFSADDINKIYNTTRNIQPELPEFFRDQQMNNSYRNIVNW